MKFKNETEESIKLRTGTSKDYVWKTVKPGNEIDVPQHTGDVSGLTRVEEPEKPKEEELAEGSSKESRPEDVHDPEVALKGYKKSLIAIKGVGPKSAEDLIAKYPTEEKLLKAVKDGEEVHNNDKVDRVVKERFSL